MTAFDQDLSRSRRKDPGEQGGAVDPIMGPSSERNDPWLIYVALAGSPFASRLSLSRPTVNIRFGNIHVKLGSARSLGQLGLG